MSEPHTFVVLAYQTSPFLEECIASVLHQTIQTTVVIATSTPNDFIADIAHRHGLQVLINPAKGRGIGADFDFARTCVDSDLVTIAHQDDVYDPGYADAVLAAYRRYPDASLIFPDGYELHDSGRVQKNLNLRVKRLLLWPLRFTHLSQHRFIKRSALRFGNAICCPAVTFAARNIHLDALFDAPFKSNVDWHAWEKLSAEKGRFVYIPQALMGHRVHAGSTTSALLDHDARSREDYAMFSRFWPKGIARLLCSAYKLSEKNNDV